MEFYFWRSLLQKTQGMTPKFIGIAKMRIKRYMRKNSAKNMESCKGIYHESRYVQVGILKNNRSKFQYG